MPRSATERSATEPASTPAPSAAPGAAVSFAGVSYPRPALRGLDFSVAPGEVLAVVGPDRATRSAVLDLALGLRRPESGAVQLFGLPPGAAIRAGKVGAMPEGGGLMPQMTAGQLVALARGMVPQPLSTQDILERAGIGESTEIVVEELTPGVRQQVRYALAIAHAPALLVLDDPARDLADAEQAHLWRDIRAARADGTAVLVAVGDLVQAEAVSDRLLVVHRGQLLADTTLARMTADLGSREIRFQCYEADPRRIEALPGVVGVDHSDGDFRVRSSEPDRTLARLHGLRLPLVNLRVAAIGLTEGYQRLLDSAQDPAGSAKPVDARIPEVAR